ncbi:NAD-dependent epimerase/dehydratase family protein [Mesorhizobium amorphae]
MLTGSSGRVGRAIFSALSAHHEVVGIDRVPFSSTHIVGDFADEELLLSALRGADAVFHAAALHAPHVGVVPDDEFQRVNVNGTRLVAEAAAAVGVTRLIFTSTTALYGEAVIPGSCSWIDENTLPLPKTIYHRTKLEAERVLESIASPEFAVRVLRMSRSFPETGDVMAAYRLHRGIDIRDVADAHFAALTNGGPHFQRCIVSAATSFIRQDCELLAKDAARLLRLRVPALAVEFERRGWSLPNSMDRVYDSAQAGLLLGWRSRFGFEEVLAQLDRRSLEVLPPGASVSRKAE